MERAARFVKWMGLVLRSVPFYKAGMCLRSFLRGFFPLVLVAMMVRAMIPAGYMPDITRDSAFYITICTASGSEKIAVDENMKPLADQGAQHDAQSGHDADMSEHCAFAVLQHVSGFVSDMTVYAHEVHDDYRHAFAFMHEDITMSAPRYLRPPSHGPPVVV